MYNVYVMKNSFHYSSNFKHAQQHYIMFNFKDIFLTSLEVENFKTNVVEFQKLIF